MEIIQSSWHWGFSGFMIVLVMFCLIYLGQRFGVSSSFKAFCSIAGAGKGISYFDYDWKSQSWLLLFVLGSVAGGFIASNFMANSSVMPLADDTLQYLSQLGFSEPSPGSIAPEEIFELSNLSNIKILSLLLAGGMLIGFGTRYAGGCTSGHAISGLSNLQLPSLVAVIGFFVGGLAMTYFILPLIFTS